MHVSTCSLSPDKISIIQKYPLVTMVPYADAVNISESKSLCHFQFGSEKKKIKQEIEDQRKNSCRLSIEYQIPLVYPADIATSSRRNAGVILVTHKRAQFIKCSLVFLRTNLLPSIDDTHFNLGVQYHIPKWHADWSVWRKILISHTGFIVLIVHICSLEFLAWCNLEWKDWDTVFLQQSRLNLLKMTHFLFLGNPYFSFFIYILSNEFHVNACIYDNMYWPIW